jgi:hypothetical protein
MDALANGFGICRARVFEGPLVDAGGVGRLVIETALSDMVSYPNPLFLVRHTYAVYPRRVEQQIDVAAAWDGAGPPVFVKEPKLTCHSIGPVGGPRFRRLSVFARDGDVLLDSFDIWSLPSPTKRTKQLGQARRCRLRFSDEHGDRELNAVMMGYGPAGRSVWQGGEGLDRWARDANGWARLRDDCAAYCLQGPADAQGNRTLSRKWELGRWASGQAGSPPPLDRPHVGVGFHAWEGGSGPPDCLCASRAMPPFGTTYQAWACYSLGDGWIV